MVYIALGIIIVVVVAYKLHITSVDDLKADLTAEVSNLEAAIAKVEPVVKAELAAAVAKIKSLL